MNIFPIIAELTGAVALLLISGVFFAIFVIVLIESDPSIDSTELLFSLILYDAICLYLAYHILYTGQISSAIDQIPDVLVIAVSAEFVICAAIITGKLVYDHGKD